MAVTKLTAVAGEESTYVIEVAFEDETGAAVIPNTSSIKWTLTDTYGNVINSRNQVAVASASTINIVLSGDDLSIGTSGLTRVILIEATYNSSLGSNLPLREEVRFNIADYVKVT